MKYACSLEMVNMLTSGPGAFTRQSRFFWTDYMKYVAAVGFSAIELPFNCFHSDAMAFETGRSGIPCSETAINEKYGGADSFLDFLNEIGISDGVADIHVSAQDAMLELLASGRKAEDYEVLAEQLFFSALDHAERLRAGCLVVSPSPEIGWLERVFGAGGELRDGRVEAGCVNDGCVEDDCIQDSDSSEFDRITVSLLEKLLVAARDKGIAVSVKNEFWSYYRKERIDELLGRIPGLRYSPDPAHIIIAGEDPLDAVRKYADRLACVRLNDTKFTDSYQNWKRINAELPVEGPQKIFSDCGEGSADLKGLKTELENAGYDGWVICENRNTLDVHKGLLKLGWFVQHAFA